MNLDVGLDLYQSPGWAKRVDLVWVRILSEINPASASVNDSWLRTCCAQQHKPESNTASPRKEPKNELK